MKRGTGTVIGGAILLAISLGYGAVGQQFGVPIGPSGSWLPLSGGVLSGSVATIGGGAAPTTAGPALSLFYDTGADRGSIYSLNNGVAWKTLYLSANNFLMVSQGSTAGLQQNTIGQVGVLKSPAFALDVAGDVNINTGQVYRVNSTAGVACNGSPTASFASIGGIVTHC